MTTAELSWYVVLGKDDRLIGLFPARNITSARIRAHRYHSSDGVWTVMPFTDYTTAFPYGSLTEIFERKAH